MQTTAGSRPSTPFLSLGSCTLNPIRLSKLNHRTLLSYRDPRHESFSALRILNEDRVAANTGFGTHSHQHYEIFSYVIGGKLEQ